MAARNPQPRRLEKAQFVGVVGDEHVFRLLVVIEHHFVVFTTDTRLFVATEAACAG